VFLSAFWIFSGFGRAENNGNFHFCARLAARHVFSPVLFSAAPPFQIPLLNYFYF